MKGIQHQFQNYKRATYICLGTLNYTQLHLLLMILEYPKKKTNMDASTQPKCIIFTQILPHTRRMTLHCLGRQSHGRKKFASHFDAPLHPDRCVCWRPTLMMNHFSLVNTLAPKNHRHYMFSYLRKACASEIANMQSTFQKCSCETK